MKLLEVERKFCLTHPLLMKFKRNTGIPPFSHISFRATNRFTDTYYDSSNTLSSKGIQVRKRGTKWEAKKRIAGNFERSVFEESSDPVVINSMIKEHLPEVHDTTANFGLDMLCRFETMREEYLADQKYSVVLDMTDFGHAVGEVELLAKDPVKAEKDIDAFMEYYRWFFKQGTPKGKLTAYFERQKATQK